MNSIPFHKIEQLFTELSELGRVEREERLLKMEIQEPDLVIELRKLFDSVDDTSSTSDQSASLWNRLVPILEKERDMDIEIERYQLIGVIGRGGMGTVYHAQRNDDYKQDVAIKVLHSGFNDQISIKRFEWERQVLAKIKHPGVARILDGGKTSDGRLYYVMELVEGQQLRDWLETEKPSLTQRLTCFIEIAEAVAEAHRMLVIHRDIKPANVRIDANGKPKLLDFGIAKQVSVNPDTSITVTRTRVYSPEYAAPEQILGEELSTAVDVYGLGILLYTMLAHSTPYKTKGLALYDLEQVILHENPIKLSRIAAQNSEHIPYDSDLLRGDLEAIALKSIRKDPIVRYASVQQLIDDVKRYIDSKPVIARDGDRYYRFKKFIKRNKTAVASVSVILLLVVGLSFVSIYSAIITEQKNKTIIAERDRAQAVSEFMQSVFRSGNPFSDQDPNITARELLDIGLMRIETNFQDNPDLRLYMKHPIVTAYKGMGLLHKTDSLLHQMHDEIRDLKPDGSIEELTILLDLAVIRDLLGDYAGSDSIHTQLQKKAKLWGYEKEPKVIEAYAEQAILNVKMNRNIDEYQTNLSKNISHLVNTEHEGSWAHIMTLMSLGSSYYYSDPKMGIQYLEEAYHHFRGAGLSESSQTLALLNNLSLLYQNSGDIANADTSYQRLLTIVDTYLMHNPGYVSTVYTNYATFLNEQKRSDDALIALQKAYDTQIHSGNPSDNNMLIIYGNLGVINQETGNHSVALDFFDKAYQIGVRMVGEDHEFMAMIYTYNGISKLHLGNIDEAKANIERGMAIRIRLQGEQHWSLGASEHALAELTLHQKDYVAAENHLKRSISLYKTVFKANHQLVVKSSEKLIDVLIQQGKSTETLAFLHDQLREMEGLTEKSDPIVRKYSEIATRLQN